MLQRIFLYATLALLLDSIGLHTNDQTFWLFVALFWASDMVGRREGFDDATELSQAILKQANELLIEAKQLRTNKGYSDENSK
jgi:hypothetical protein